MGELKFALKEENREHRRKLANGWLLLCSATKQPLSADGKRCVVRFARQSKKNYRPYLHNVYLVKLNGDKEELEDLPSERHLPNISDVSTTHTTQHTRTHAQRPHTHAFTHTLTRHTHTQLLRERRARQAEHKSTWREQRDELEGSEPESESDADRSDPDDEDYTEESEHSDGENEKEGEDESDTESERKRQPKHAQRRRQRSESAEPNAQSESDQKGEASDTENASADAKADKTSAESEDDTARDRARERRAFDSPPRSTRKLSSPPPAPRKAHDNGSGSGSASASSASGAGRRLDAAFRATAPAARVVGRSKLVLSDDEAEEPEGAAEPAKHAHSHAQRKRPRSPDADDSAGDADANMSEGDTDGEEGDDNDDEEQEQETDRPAKRARVASASAARPYPDDVLIKKYKKLAEPTDIKYWFCRLLFDCALFSCLIGIVLRRPKGDALEAYERAFDERGLQYWRKEHLTDEAIDVASLWE